MHKARRTAAEVAYLESRITSAQPQDLITILYEVVLHEISVARHCLSHGDPMGRSEAVSKAIQGLNELLLSLGEEPADERSKRLRMVYGYLQSELLEAHARQSDDRFAKAAETLSVMHQNWRQTCAMLRDQNQAALTAEEGAAEKPEAMPEPDQPEPAFAGAGAMWDQQDSGMSSNRRWEA